MRHTSRTSKQPLQGFMVHTAFLGFNKIHIYIYIDGVQAKLVRLMWCLRHGISIPSCGVLVQRAAHIDTCWVFLFNRKSVSIVSQNCYKSSFWAKPPVPALSSKGSADIPQASKQYSSADLGG